MTIQDIKEMNNDQVTGLEPRWLDNQDDASPRYHALIAALTEEGFQEDAFYIIESFLGTDVYYFADKVFLYIPSAKLLSSPTQGKNKAKLLEDVKNECLQEVKVIRGFLEKKEYPEYLEYLMEKDSKGLLLVFKSLYFSIPALERFRLFEMVIDATAEEMDFFPEHLLEDVLTNTPDDIKTTSHKEMIDTFGDSDTYTLYRAGSADDQPFMWNLKGSAPLDAMFKKPDMQWMSAEVKKEDIPYFKEDAVWVKRPAAMKSYPQYRSDILLSEIQHAPEMDYLKALVQNFINESVVKEALLGKKAFPFEENNLETHDQLHLKRTMFAVLLICQKRDIDLNKTILALFAAAIHDMFKTKDSVEEGHGQIAVQAWKQMLIDFHPATPDQKDVDQQITEAFNSLIDSFAEFYTLPQPKNYTWDELHCMFLAVEGHDLPDQEALNLFADLDEQWQEYGEELLFILKDADSLERLRYEGGFDLGELHLEESKQLITAFYDARKFVNE